MIILPEKIRWFITIAALLAMVISAMIAANIVKKGNIAITNLSRDIYKSEKIIESLWQNALAKENNARHLVLYTLIRTQGNKDVHHLDGYYKKLANINIDAPLSPKILPNILNDIDQEKQDTIDRINDIFLEKQIWEEDIITRSRENTMLWNIAMLVQLLSLAIITIVRDLK